MAGDKSADKIVLRPLKKVPKRVTVAWWLFWIWGFALAAGAYVRGGPPDLPPIDFTSAFAGALVGGHLFTIVAAILFATAVKRGHPGRPGVGLASSILLLIVSVGWSVNDALRERQKAPEVVAEMRDDFERFFAGELSHLPDDQDGISSTGSEHAKTDLEKVHEFARQLMIDVTEMLQQYETELIDAGWYTVLDFQRLSEDRDFVRVRKTLGRVSDIRAKYQQRHIAMIARLNERIDALDIAPSAKAAMQDSFSRTKVKRIETARKQWDLARQCLAQFEAWIDLLEASDAWRVEGGQLVYERSPQGADLERQVVAVGEKLSELFARQAQVEKELKDRLRGMLDRLQERVRR